MKSLLILIDLQQDFLQRPGLLPRSDRLIRRVERLLQGFRVAQIPVFHVWTQVHQDGSNRMPHWKRQNTWCCVEGTPGVSTPEALQPQSGELVFTKQYFSAFSNPSLKCALQEYKADSLVLAGIFLQECIRSSALDAYELGFEVWIADDAVGSDDPGHAEITRRYLHERTATFLDTHYILSQIGGEKISSSTISSKHTRPVANIGGTWVEADGHIHVDRYNPSHWNEKISSVPLATASDVNEACTQAFLSQRSWRETSLAKRATMLDSWAETLSRREQELAQLLAREIGKPLISGYDEIRMAISFIRATAQRCLHSKTDSIDHGEPVHICYRPHGVIGLITPWNNPIAIPGGKIAPALAFGNTVIWKPAVEAPQTSIAVLDALHQAGGKTGIVNLVFGEEFTGREIIQHPVVSALSFTGSTEAGQSIAALCAHFGKPLQAELGGNNAAIICCDCDLRKEAGSMALSAFSFSGQRCTSIQRFLVERPILQDFRKELVQAVESLTLGDPLHSETTVGPLVSKSHQQWIQSLLNQATKSGAEIYCGGTIPHQFQHGCWFSPTVLGQVDLNSPLSQQEIFGPVALVHPVESLDEAIEVNNSVKFGLAASIYTQDESTRGRFADAIEAGIVNVTQHPLEIHPSAPFGGWKGSGIGPPEHGDWDQLFYTRPQTVYGLTQIPS